MNRILAFVVVVATALVVGILVGPMSIVRAGSAGGLTGRTHLIVKEPNLKTLSVFVQGSTPSVSTTLRERSRDGSLGPIYTVPAGRVFILTDVRVDAFPGTRSSHYLHATVSGVNGDRWTFTPDNGDDHDVVTEHLSGGLPFQPGSTVDFTVTTQAASGSAFDVRIDVLGYDTVDVP